jgi:MYXO-CTERM domain-containing protein
MVADGPGNTYPLLERSYGIEVPDCKHMVPHWTEEMDAELGKFVFVAHAHVNQDDDRCINTDRQRTELRGRGTGVQGPLNSTRYYRWKFKLPNGFQPSGSFTHIFQIKAYGNGHGSGAPIMTLTPRNSTFAIDGRIGVRGQTNLSKFLGVWVVVDLMIVHADAGRLSMTIKNLRTGEMLFQHTGTADMYDDGAGYSAPKHGIYRSLNQAGSLRDEQVRFADFCVSDTSAAECDDGSAPPPPPPPPVDAGATPADAGTAPDSAGTRDTAGAVADAGTAADRAPGATGGTGGGGTGGSPGATGGASGATGGASGGATGGSSGSATGGSSGSATGGSSGTATGGARPPTMPPPSPDPQPDPRTEDGGCACSLGATAGAAGGSAPALVLALGALVLRRRRRRIR